MNRSLAWVLLAALFAAAPAFAQSRAEEEAGDVSEVDKDSAGPLRDRIRPVSGHLLLMGGRFEVSPGLAISFRDAFFSKYVLGAALTYHFNEDYALSLKAGYAIDTIAGSAQICSPAGGCSPPTMDQLTKYNGQSANVAYGLINLLASLDFQWSPLYGKISLVAERFLHFNMYALGGPAIVSYGPNATITPGANLGAGFRFFINRFLTVRTELRDTIYMEDGVPAPNSSLRNQLMVDLGISIFFPMEFREAR